MDRGLFAVFSGLVKGNLLVRLVFFIRVLVIFLL